MAHRSASGSRAIARAASTSAARASTASEAPRSSGFGNSTVGKSGFGWNCSSTRWMSVMPAAFRVATAVAPPTP
ncbi:Uncharacterised protein [Mycobacteroides abscessus subsp. abscessus]|nr:Uncharacterised protein [Mycobacteroides abscessus subsp. abscessus]